MENSILCRALKETWRNKDKFYQATKNLSMKEIIKKVESSAFASKQNIRKTAHG
jgi:hypothetical protein